MHGPLVSYLEPEEPCGHSTALGGLQTGLQVCDQLLKVNQIVLNDFTHQQASTSSQNAQVRRQVGHSINAERFTIRSCSFKKKHQFNRQQTTRARRV